MKNLLYVFSLFLIVSCKPAKIQVENNVSKTILKNIEWGGVPLSSSLMPGERSAKIEISDNGYYDIDLPDSYILEFVIDVNGDLIYLETVESFKLDHDDDKLFEITDSTEVTNPLLDGLKTTTINNYLKKIY